MRRASLFATIVIAGCAPVAPAHAPDAGAAAEEAMRLHQEAHERLLEIHGEHHRAAMEMHEPPPPLPVP